MESFQICNLASQIRSSTNTEPNILTLSTTTLCYLLSSFEMIEDQSTSFHVMPTHSFKAELILDLQYLSNYFRQTNTLKLFNDSSEPAEAIDVSKFGEVTCLEFHRVDVNSVRGLQAVRSQLQKIVCQKTSNSLSEVLCDCGGDKSCISCWTELKDARFISNIISVLDVQSLECAPCLHTLDLSHNQIVNIEAICCLHNLKYLNLSYNKIEALPPLRGPICARLHNLILKNNFIEDISGLHTLTNLWVLDLGNNCLVDHKSLVALSHLAALQWLNLQDNPLGFHPNHRNRTACYLHTNTASTHFVLDNTALSKNDKKLVGSLYPLQSKNNTLATDSVNLASDKGRRVRHVVIEDDTVIREPTTVLSATPRLYLETKKQIEDLHEKFGESWLNSHSGLLDVLGLESYSSPLSVSPYQADFTIYSGDFNRTAQVEVVETTNEDVSEVYRQELTPDVSLDEIDVEGEESIYLATVKTESEPIFIVIEQTHLSERECSTGNERHKWHLESITNCEIIEGSNTVRIDFDTMRKDRKQRLYVFDEEMEAFVAFIRKRMREPKKDDGVMYTCMKCNTIFRRVEKGLVLGEPAAVVCPNCDSTLIVEA